MIACCCCKPQNFQQCRNVYLTLLYPMAMIVLDFLCSFPYTLLVLQQSSFTPKFPGYSSFKSTPWTFLYPLFPSLALISFCEVCDDAITVDIQYCTPLRYQDGNTHSPMALTLKYAWFFDDFVGRMSLVDLQDNLGRWYRSTRYYPSIKQTHTHSYMHPIHLLR